MILTHGKVDSARDFWTPDATGCSTRLPKQLSWESGDSDLCGLLAGNTDALAETVNGPSICTGHGSEEANLARQTRSVHLCDQDLIAIHLTVNDASMK